VKKQLSNNTYKNENIIREMDFVKALLIVPYYFERLLLSIAMTVSKRIGSLDLQDSPMRLAILRRNCTESHANHIIEIFEDLARIKNQLSVFEIMSQPKCMRYFN
tara:strand:- start:29 stop:343 length:315 start_codon:yes stop_codon:yes gene_type:complete